MDPLDIKKILKGYYEQLFAHKFENSQEIDQIFERYNLQELSQGETDNLSVTSVEEIKSILIRFSKENAYDLKFGNLFLDMILKAQSIKKNKKF